jgi:hypothetical protein
MSRFGKTLFSGSRLIFWSLAPILGLIALVLPFLVRKWNASSIFWVTSTEILLVTLCLSLNNPVRFRWASRCVTAVVFCAYLAYLIEEVFWSGKNLMDTGDRSEASPANAILGFIAIGLPCLWYALLGRFTFRSAREYEEIDRA